MTYSVWNQAALAYDYYQSAKQSRLPSAPTPRHLRASSKHGTDPTAAAWPLPAHARRVGRGELAKGYVASRRSGLGALGIIPFDLTGPNLVISGVVAFLVYKHWWKGKR